MLKLIEILEDGYEYAERVDTDDEVRYEICGCDYTLILTNTSNSNDFDADDIAATIASDVADTINELEDGNYDVDDTWYVADNNGYIKCELTETDDYE